MRRALSAFYNVNVARPTVARAASTAQVAQPRSAQAVRSRFEQAVRSRTPMREHWSEAAHVPSFTSVRWENALRLPRQLISNFQDALGLQEWINKQNFQHANRMRAELGSRFDAALQHSMQPAQLHFQDAIHLRSNSATVWHEAVRLIGGIATDFGPGLPVRLRVLSRFQQAWVPRPGISPSTRPPEPQPCYVPGLPIDLLFDQSAISFTSPVHLVFRCGGSPLVPAVVVVPIRRTYVTVNSITLHRLDTGAELRAHAFNMSLDEGAWTWSWSATLHHDAEGHLSRDEQGDPAELLAEVNGVQFRLRMESVARDRRFSPTRFNVQGRGRAAILSSPYAPAMQFGNQLAARTAQQLMADALTINGVSIGWGVDWGLQDWLVPAGTWSFNGTYIDAINEIAKAAGGYVQPHATDAVLRILPRYPVKPWAWGSVTPAFEIPEDSAEVEVLNDVNGDLYRVVTHHLEEFVRQFK